MHGTDFLFSWLEEHKEGSTGDAAGMTVSLCDETGTPVVTWHVDKAIPVKLDAPTFDAIADGDYPVSRPLYFYVKKAHVDVIPGLRDFLREFSSERAWGEEGYLSDRGLIPMPDEERRAIARNVRELTPLTLASQ